MSIDYVNDATKRASRMIELSHLIQQEKRAIQTQTVINGRLPIDLVELLQGHQKELEDLKEIEKRHRELINEQKERFEKEDIRYPANAEKPMKESLPISPKKWQGDKNDLAELIHALYKSERIRDPHTGQKVTQQDLIKMFEFMFGVEFKDFDGSLGKKLRTFKSNDGKTFTSELKEVIDKRIAQSKSFKKSSK